MADTIPGAVMDALGPFPMSAPLLRVPPVLY